MSGPLLRVFLLRIQAEQVDGAVAGAGGQVTSIEGDVDAVDTGGRQLPLPAFRFCGQVPENDPAAVAYRSQATSIRAESHLPDHAEMTLKSRYSSPSARPGSTRWGWQGIQPYDLIQAAEGNHLSIRGESHGVNRSPATLQNVLRIPRPEAAGLSPHSNRAVKAGGQNGFPIGREGHRLNVVQMTLEHRSLLDLGSGQIPSANRPITAARNQHGSIRRKLQRFDGRSMAGQDGDGRRLGGRQVPKPDLSIEPAGAGGQNLIVWREG